MLGHQKQTRNCFAIRVCKLFLDLMDGFTINTKFQLQGQIKLLRKLFSNSFLYIPLYHYTIKKPNYNVA